MKSKKGKKAKVEASTTPRERTRTLLSFENDPVAPEAIVMPTPPRERVSLHSRWLCTEQ